MIFHNTLDIAEVVRELQAEGGEIEPLDLADIAVPDRAHQPLRRVLHTLGIAPEDYDTRLDINFTTLDDERAPAV
ncbi:hypothetical protein [Streptomyces yangpuensis]|uniref:hypothetical protein n=1 Tax=Streptomyces yangpuensis TaxID=1648182 RepID=UPI00364EBDB0